MTTAPILSFSAAGESVPVALDPARIRSGDPITTVDNRYSSSDEKFHAGLWTSTVGSWRVSYTENEYCMLIRGRVRLQSDDGASHVFGPGDGFVIPAGFSGTWETLEDCVKHYVIYDAG